MKNYRLVIHEKNFSDEDLFINPKDYPEAKEGDIVEIYDPNEDLNPRLLLQIKAFKDDLSKDTISIKSSIASTFGLRTFVGVCMSIKDPASVALDSIELTFKDQYMGRSDMWRLKKSLTNSCVYLNKKLEFCGGAVRCQVYEMWSQGDRVACGVLNDDTKVVFRSSTSMVYLFLQMSSEMWDFDIYGDLYFEKAVNGFLADLFQKWKKNGSNHEVTIVLFSRTFYEASNLEEFPLHMRECLQKDYKGRYYEDFYRVAIQNEKYDDWSGILVQLRRVFSEYLRIVLEYHKRPGQTIPAASNSTAAQGNFLEVLNMSLNVFEKHYLDRSFDRTGQLSVVLTPGVGVFEVDRELTNITKQRIIDNGVGSDLVCVGEQPLHAVPLLKFHNKDTHLNVPDDYSMPHWINLSFYSTNKKIAYSTFIPRIKLPPSLDKNCNNMKPVPIIGQNAARNYGSRNFLPDEDCIHNSFFDYDAYDAQVFQLPPPHALHDNNGYHRTTKCKRTSGGLLDAKDLRGQRRKLSDPDIQHSFGAPQRSQPIAIRPAMASPVISPANDGLDKVLNGMEKELSPPLRMVVGSEGSPPLESKALINPFDPSHVTIKLTSNRRRWTHIFPKGPTGVLIQQHHYQAVPTQQSNDLDSSGDSDKGVPTSGAKNISVAALHEYCKKRPNVHPHTPGVNMHPKNPSKSLTLLWGATGEQEWTPALTTVNDIIIGVDWKSLTISACLPITTDYFPDKRALQIDYVVSQYNLLPDDVNADYAQQRAIYKKPLTTEEVFRELVSQRLAQGFQLILTVKTQTSGNSGALCEHAIKPTALLYSTGVSSTSLLRKRTPEMEDSETYCLSIGRLFHKISLSGNSITVTRYRPRHPYPGFNYQYRYRFHAPHHDTYEESYASFTTEKLEHFNWNYLDHYICTRGDTDFVLVDALKYWRFRVYLLPFNNAATKRIIEGAPHCDIYTVSRSCDHQQMVEGFLKFVETIVNYNKIKRPHKARLMSLIPLNPNHPNAPIMQPRRNSMSAVHSQNNMATNSPYRERLGSNRLPERPRQRPGLKAIERACWPVDISQSTIHDNSQNDANNEDSNSAQSELILKSTASHVEILEAMKNFDTGVGFLNTHQSLPTHTFVSSEAANWIYINMEGVSSVDEAVQILKNMHKAELICHASGNSSKQFYYGFYLYHIVQTNTDDKDYCTPSGDLQTFENEWLEVEIRPPLNWGLPLPSTNPTVPAEHIERERGVPHFLCDDIDFNYVMGDSDFDSVYKRMHLEIDISNKSDRVEWGHARYQTVFRPDQAYELVIEWLTASGSIVSEMLYWWMRKAQFCGLQLVPIPHDPLALPYSNKSDPLRGPIFIPLNTKCLEEPEFLFKEFREDTALDRIFLFQEAIISRFGFIKCLVEPTTTNATSTSGNTTGLAGNVTSTATTISTEHQYIHCTGTVFILISSPASKTRLRLGSASLQHKRHLKVQNTHALGLRIPQGRYSDHADVVPSPHEAYITRHVSGKNKDDYDNSRRMGFLWSWNHMVSKRWRTNQSVDNNFQVKLLRDFREFCANSHDRLRNYWEESWEIKETASSAH